MFISKYSIENWESNRNNGLLQEAKDWPEVETAIRELDGHHRTLVTLETESETHMSIGGGNGKYFVYTTFDNENFNYLVNSAPSEIGIGTVAGVAKANADIIQISGHDGGTGASLLSSIKHAGSPWELGLTEVHRVLMENQLPDQVLLRVDGASSSATPVSTEPQAATSSPTDPQANALPSATPAPPQ
jgi:hypothetical protein